MDSFYASAHFLSVLDQRADGVNGLASRAGWDALEFQGQQKGP